MPSSFPKPSLNPSATVEGQRFIHRVDWNLFRQFHDIAQSGSLSAAARRLNQKQPSLSAALRRLEGHFGVQLCRRTARGIELTAAGNALLQLCNEMVETIRAAPHLTSEAAKQVEGKLSIHLISNVISREFNEALSSFHARHKKVEIYLTVAPWRNVLEALALGIADVGITYDSGPRTPLQYEPLFRETQQIYCGRSHHLYGRRISKPALIAQEPFILTQGDEPEDLERFRKRYRIGENSVGTAEDLHEAARLIQLGIGIGFLPTLAVESRNDLWPLLSTPLLPSYFIYLVVPPSSRITTPTQLFLDEMRRRLRANRELG